MYRVYEDIKRQFDRSSYGSTPAELPNIMASTDRITRYVIATGIVMSQKCPGTIA
jgi:hypothetical protein